MSSAVTLQGCMLCEQKERLFPVAARAKRLQGAIDAMDNAVLALHRRLR